MHGIITPWVQQRKTDIINARKKWNRTMQTEEGKERKKAAARAKRAEEEEARQRRGLERHRKPTVSHQTRSIREDE
jgi:hypothetical protein